MASSSGIDIIVSDTEEAVIVLLHAAGNII
jgi:hypothetical protein